MQEDQFGDSGTTRRGVIVAEKWRERRVGSGYVLGVGWPRWLVGKTWGLEEG